MFYGISVIENSSRRDGQNRVNLVVWIYFWLFVCWTTITSGEISVRLVMKTLHMWVLEKKSRYILSLKWIPKIILKLELLPQSEGKIPKITKIIRLVTIWSIYLVGTKLTIKSSLIQAKNLRWHYCNSILYFYKFQQILLRFSLREKLEPFSENKYYFLDKSIFSGQADQRGLWNARISNCYNFKNICIRGFNISIAILLFVIQFTCNT